MSNLRRTLLLLSVTVLIPIVPFVVVGELPGERWLSLADTRDAVFAAVGASLLLADVLLPVPSSIVITLMGARLGAVEGWLVAWLGITLGNLVGYAVGRLWPARWAPDVAQTPTVLTLLFTRPVPVLAEAMVISAGAARAPLGLVLGACASGNAIYTLILAASGALLLSERYAALAMMVVLGLLAGAWLVWQRLAAKAATPGPQA